MVGQRVRTMTGPSIQVVITTLLALCLESLSSEAAVPSVNAKLGRIVGSYCEGTNEVAQYLGIPFAKPPVGNLRWASPQPYAKTYPKAGYQATAPGAWCMQILVGQGFYYGPNQTISEDCLYLNVWVPASATTASKLPVRLFLHGGSDRSGSGAWNQYFGCQIVKDSPQIVVTINYRLMALGFLALHDLRDKKGYPKGSHGTTGNWGLLDQRLALQWVQQNIAAFGGDPTRVLLFGESAGGFNVFSHMMMPRSYGLYSAAICESGSPDFGRVFPQNDAYQIGQKFVTALGCNATSSKVKGFRTIKDCLLKADAAAVLSASVAIKPLQFGPTIDGVELLQSPLELMRQGALNKIPFMIGTNAREGYVAVTGTYPNSAYTNTITYEEYLGFIQDKMLIPSMYLNQTLTQYNASNFNGSWFDAAAAMYTQSHFHCSSLRGGKYFGPRSSVYIYKYTQAPTMPQGCYLQNGYGYKQKDIPLVSSAYYSAHSTELPIVFMLPYAGKDINGNCNYTAEEKQFASFMSGMWTAMSSQGKPLPPMSKTLTASQFKNVTWPKYDPVGQQVLDLNYQKPQPFKWELKGPCQLWDSMVDYIYGPGGSYFS